MDKMDVLMLDGCTHREAEKHLKNGTRVFDSIAEYIECMEADGYSVQDDVEEKINIVRNTESLFVAVAVSFREFSCNHFITLLCVQNTISSTSTALFSRSSGSASGS